MLAAAVGPHLTKLLHDQLDLMFAAGLSEPLVQALTAIVHSISPLLGTIQGSSATLLLDFKLTNVLDKLLNLLSMILGGQPYKPLGAPATLVHTETSASNRELTSQASALPHYR